eukprot:3762162-Rhodomonas_salina.4
MATRSSTNVQRFPPSSQPAALQPSVRSPACTNPLTCLVSTGQIEAPATSEDHGPAQRGRSRSGLSFDAPRRQRHPASCRRRQHAGHSKPWSTALPLTLSCSLLADLLPLLLHPSTPLTSPLPLSGNHAFLEASSEISSILGSAHPDAQQPQPPNAWASQSKRMLQPP